MQHKNNVRLKNPLNLYFPLTFLSLSILFASCGSRALNTTPDASPPDQQTTPPTTDGQPPQEECVISVSLHSCCGTISPIQRSIVEKDPCIIPYPPPENLNIPLDCTPGDCLEHGPCPIPTPVSKFVEAAPGGGCKWKSECQTAADCVVAEDCRSHFWENPNQCCSCGTVFPFTYAKKNPCINLSGPEAPIPDSCAKRCPDKCWPPNPGIMFTCEASPQYDDLKLCVNKPNPPSGGYILWQAPGGKAGTGPVLEIFSIGNVRLSTSSSAKKPHQSWNWEKEYWLDKNKVKELFNLFEKINFNQLPYKKTISGECYPSLYYEPCNGCTPISLNYNSAIDLLPDFQAIYSWLDNEIKQYQAALPNNYCMFYDTQTSCGKLKCDFKSEICVMKSTGILFSQACIPVPSGCEYDRTCNCVGPKLCTGITKFCTNQSTPNTISCECPNCS